MNTCREHISQRSQSPIYYSLRYTDCSLELLRLDGSECVCITFSQVFLIVAFRGPRFNGHGFSLILDYPLWFLVHCNKLDLPVVYAGQIKDIIHPYPVFPIYGLYTIHHSVPWFIVLSGTVRWFRLLYPDTQCFLHRKFFGCHGLEV